jgi:hypothetical protein
MLRIEHVPGCVQHGQRIKPEIVAQSCDAGDCLAA